jgi:hypothetical protein
MYAMLLWWIPRCPITMHYAWSPNNPKQSQTTCANLSVTPFAFSIGGD